MIPDNLHDEPLLPVAMAAIALAALIAAAERDLERRSEAHTLTACGNCGCGVRPSLAIEIAGKPWCRKCVQERVDAEGEIVS